LVRQASRNDGFVALAPADRFLAGTALPCRGNHHRGAGRDALLSRMRFDFDPMHLQTRTARRSAPTASDHGPGARDQLGHIVAPSVAQVDQITQRTVASPRFSETRSIHNLVPSDQDRKLPVIQRAATTLGPAIKSFGDPPGSSDGETVSAIRRSGKGSEPRSRPRRG